MPYDEALATRIRQALSEQEGITEIRMFGGVCFMLHGNMLTGVIKDELMVRIARDAFHEALSQPGARPMDFSGRPMPGMVYVAPTAIESSEKLSGWLDRALSNARNLPPKEPSQKSRSPRTPRSKPIP